MTYVAWAVLYEGETDAAYFDILLPRIMEDLALSGPRSPTIPNIPSIRLRRGPVNEVAAEACKNADAFYLLFIHSDTGGRAVQNGLAQRSTAYCEAMRELCGLQLDRCITIAPRHETEAWVLADPEAIVGALGYRGRMDTLGLPANAAEAERLADPKATLKRVVSEIRGRRNYFDVDQIFPAIAQRQQLTALRRARSFQSFERQVVTALRSLGCL